MLTDRYGNALSLLAHIPDMSFPSEPSPLITGVGVLRAVALPRHVA
jgi:hypothetical protein